MSDRRKYDKEPVDYSRWEERKEEERAAFAETTILRDRTAYMRRYKTPLPESLCHFGSSDRQGYS